jgi:hypothetical protein
LQENESNLEDWFQPQLLRQESAMDCGVCVFGALTKLSREEILSDMPDATNGKTLDQPPVSVLHVNGGLFRTKASGRRLGYANGSDCGERNVHSLLSASLLSLAGDVHSSLVRNL